MAIGYLIQVRVPFLIAIGILRSDGSWLGEITGIEDELGIELLVKVGSLVPKG